MPPARTATSTATTQDQTRPRRSSERKTTYRAASVPAGQRENLRLESLRPKKQKLSLLDVEDIPPRSLPSVVIARGRKRALSSCVTPQANCVASTSAPVAEPIAGASEQRPRKRHKRSSSTPAAPRPSQLSTQLQSRRRSRSRVGSPTTDVEYVPPSRVSARLSRRIQSLIDVRGSDIYTHLADPNGAGNLLSEPLVGSVVLPTPNKAIGSQSVKASRGRGRRTIDLTDENAKRDLMEEWARLRQFQGTLPLSGINGNACLSQTLLDDNRKGTGSASSTQLETTTRRSSPDADLMQNQAATIVSISQSREAILDVSLRGSSSTQIDSGNALLVTNAPGKKLDHKDSVLPSDGGTERPVVPSLDIETPSTPIFDSHLDEAPPTDEPAGVPETAPDLLQCPRSPPPSLSATRSQENSVLIRHMELTGLPADERAKAVSLNNPPKDGHPATFPKTYPFDNGNIHLDSDEEFYMLDIPEIFTLPWVPVSSHLYVPPSLAKLVSGMREQLTMEARARRRVEELYQAELSRRISAEKIIEDLRAELQERRKDSPENQLAERQEDG